MSKADWLIDGTMEKAQRDALESALLTCRYNIGATAARLRVGRSTVYRLLTKYEIAIPARPQRSQADTGLTQGSRPLPVNDVSRIVIREGKLYMVTDGRSPPAR